MKENKENVSEILRLIIYGIILGLIVGIVLSAYRLLVTFFSAQAKTLYQFGRQSLGNGLIVLLLSAVLGGIVGLLTQSDPKIGGSGIPQVTGQLTDRMRVSWQSLLPKKFLGGLIGLSMGLTLGREGPSVQMGAGMGQALAEISKQKEADRKLLITAGAAAGLSAAFQAPIAGVSFILEELHARFHKSLLFPSMAASLFAAYCGAWIVGNKPVVELGHLPSLPLSSYALFALLGVLIGILAPIFTKGIYYFKQGYQRLPGPISWKVILPFLLTGIMILWDPNLFGSGQEMMLFPVGENPGMGSLAFFYGAKLLLLLVAFSSGMPGGIFLPMLVLGSLTGNIFGQVLVHIGLISSDEVILFAALAMGANFAAIVRSPITAIFLAIELTGSFLYLLPIGLVVFFAYCVVELLHLEPVYEMLLRLQLKQQGAKQDSERRS